MMEVMATNKQQHHVNSFFSVKYYSMYLMILHLRSSLARGEHTLESNMSCDEHYS